MTNVDNSGANTVDNNNKAMCVWRKRVCEKSLPDSVFFCKFKSALKKT